MANRFAEKYGAQPVGASSESVVPPSALTQTGSSNRFSKTRGAFSTPSVPEAPWRDPETDYERRTAALARGDDVPDEHPVARTERRMGAFAGTKDADMPFDEMGMGAAGYPDPGFMDAAARLPSTLAKSVPAAFDAAGESIKNTIADEKEWLAEQAAKSHAAGGYGLTPEQTQAAVKADVLRAGDAALESIAARRHYQQAQKRGLDALSPDAGSIERNIVGGLTSVAQTAPTVLAGALIPGAQVPALVAMGGQVSVDKYTDFVSRGVDQGPAAMQALLLGPLEALTEKIPLGTLAKNSPFLKKLAEFAVTDLVGENISSQAEMLSELNLGLRDEITSEDFLQAIKDTTAQTLVAAGAQTSAVQILQSASKLANDRAVRKAAELERIQFGNAEEFAKMAAPPMPDIKIDAPQLTGPREDADFEVGTEGVARRPGESVPVRAPLPQLPAPGPTGEFEAGSEGVRQLSRNEVNEAEARRAEQVALGKGVLRAPITEDAQQTSKKAKEIKPESVGPAPLEKVPQTAASRRALHQAKVETLRDAITEIVDPNEITLEPDGDRFTIKVRNKPSVSFDSKELASQELSDIRAEVRAARAGTQTHKVLGRTIESPAQPTPKQATAGNYKKPTIAWKGLDIKVENIKDSTRSGVGADGVPWSRTMASDYGYFPGTKSTDGEGVDVYMGPQRGVKTAYVIDQLTPDGLKHDEPKVVIGVRSEQEAKKLYLKHYPKGWKGLGAITPMPVDGLKAWLRSDETQSPLSWQPPVPKGPKEPARSTRHAQPSRDSILEYLSKTKLHGAAVRGLDIDAMASEGLDPAEMRKALGHGINRPFTKGGGTLDHAAEILTEQGYPVGGDKNKLLDLITAEIRNGKKTTAGERGVESQMEKSIAKAQESAPADALPENVDDMNAEELAAFEAKLNRLQNDVEAKREREAIRAESGVQDSRRIVEDQYDDEGPLFARRDDVTTDMFSAPAPKEAPKPVAAKPSPTNTADMFGSAPVMKEAPKPVEAKKEPEAPAQKMMSADDRIRKIRGLTMEKLRAYDADAAVRKVGNKWTYTTYYGTGSQDMLDTKREARLKARAHIDFLTDQYERPSDYTHVLSEVAREQLKLYETYKYKYSGETEMEIWARINKEIPDEIPDEPEAKMPEPIPEKPKADSAPLSKIIEKANDKHGSELGYADRIFTAKSFGDFETRINNGEVSLEEYKASWVAAIKSRSTLKADFEKMTKEQLAKFSGSMRPGEKKDSLVSEAETSVLSTFKLAESAMIPLLRDISTYDSYKKAIGDIVENATQETMDAYVAKIKARRAEYDERKAGFDDPKTLEDFQTFIRYKGEKKLTDEQMERFDALMADESIQKLKDAKERRERERATVQSAGRTVGAKVIPAKHTKHGYDIFVVQMGERVERDVYEKLNTAAKQLGGYYSSYRGGGAIPGFTFKDAGQAQSFAALLETGDTSAASEAVQERRDDYKEDKSQSTVERLRSMADRLEESAQDRLNQDRKTNTSRRAGMAARAEQQARGDLSFALTMRNIAQSIEDGKAKFLEGVRTKVQIEMLYGFLNRARYNEANARAKIDNGESSWVSESNRLKYMDQPPTAATARHVDYPYYWIQTGDLASLGRSLVEIDGAKQLGDSIVKKMDDISKEYTAFVKDNLHLVTLFTNKGNIAVFDSKGEAERIRLLSPSSQKMVVVSLGRGKNHVVLSPREAISRKLWEGPPEKRIRLNPDMAIEIMDKVDRHNSKAANRFKQVHYPYMFSHAKEERARLEAMGIVNPSMLREAMREFIALRTEPAKADPIKALMRALVGRKDVGIDFFPTPPEEAANVIAKAGIELGMDVLDAGAGYGALADEVRAVGVEPDVVEMSSTLVEILEAKGYEVVGRDFMGYSGKQYDRIVMNPPFSNGRDIDFVRHAYDNLLKPGGRIVSIMGEGVFFRQDAKATAFREFSDSIGAYDEQLPAGTFLDPSLPVTTGANARVIVIDKPKGELDSPLAFRTEKSIAGALTENEIRAEANRFLDTLKTKPKLVIVPSHAGLPADLMAASSEDWAASNVNAVYWKGTVYIVQDRMRTPEQVREIVIHETAHFAVATLFDREARHALLDELVKVNRMETVRRGVEAFGKTVRDADGKVISGFDPGNPMHRRVAANEVMAYYAQKYLKNESMPARIKRVVERWVAAIRDAINRFFGRKQALDELHLKAVIQDAINRLKRGDDVMQAAADSRSMAMRDSPDGGMKSFKIDMGLMGEWTFKPKNEVPTKGRELVASRIIQRNVEVPRSVANQYELPASTMKAFRVSVIKNKDGSMYSQVEAMGDNHGRNADGSIPTEFVLLKDHQLDLVELRGVGGVAKQMFDEASVNDAQGSLFAKPVPTYFSALTRAAETAKLNKGTPQQWSATLKNTQGVKAEEIEWSGLDEWLAQQTSPVTKEQVVEFLRANEIEVKDVVKGAAAGTTAADGLLRQHDEKVVEMTSLGFTPDSNVDDDLLGFEANNTDDRFYFEDGEWKNDYEFKEPSARVIELANEIQALRREMAGAEFSDDVPTSATRHAQWVLPGGSQYRELLLTLPERNPVKVGKSGLPDSWKVRPMTDSSGTKSFEILQEDGTPIVDYMPEYITNQMQANGWAAEWYRKNHSDGNLPDTGGNYTSGHWSEKNILAHVRFDERTDADGKRVLHIAEVQSDWHQAGRKRSYAKNATPEKIAELKADGWSVESTAIDPSKPSADPSNKGYRVRRYLTADTGAITNTEQAAWDAIAKRGSVPDAPFKTTWPELAMKRMIRWASENGFDRITWDTGKTNADRYSLSKQISRLTYRDAGTGGIADADLDYQHDSGGTLIAYDLRGSKVIDKYVSDQDELADTIGKEAAERLLNAKPERIRHAGMGFRERELSGLELEVGGEGMIGFYDKILPATVNKMVKKWGGKVSPSSIKTESEFEQYEAFENSHWIHTFDSRSAAQRWVDTQPHNRYFKGVGVPVAAHGLDITPAMRDAAMEGLPLFNRADGGMMRTGQVIRGTDQHNWYSRRAQGLIDVWNKKIGYRYGALGNLPEAKQYLVERYKTLGGLDDVKQISRKIFDTLHAATEADSARVYEYLTNADATPDAIEDEKVRSMAMSVKQAFDEQGRLLVQLGLLPEESYEKYAGQYLPRLYLRHVLNDQLAGRSVGTGKKMSDQGNLKRRKDIPEEVRKVILGEITDPAFLASFGVSRTMRDLQIMNFLDAISRNKSWTPPVMMIEYDGRRVSPYWLYAEAKQLRYQADHIKQPVVANKARRLADSIETMANEARDALGEEDLSDFQQIPDSPRYGVLRGVYVRKEIHEDLVGAYNFVDTSNMTGLSKALADTFKQGGLMSKATGAWKTSKVALNVPSHIRNMIGNAIMLHMSGINGAMLPVRFVQAINSVATKDQYYQLAVKYGLRQATFANSELLRIRDEWILLQKTKKPLLNKLHAMLSVGLEKVGDVYQFEEAIFKVMKLRDEMEKGASESDAMIQAHKWVFDYSLVPRTVRYLRNAPFGVPFLSYSYFALPRLAETAIKKPWKFLPYIAMGWALEEYVKSLFGADDDELERLRKSFPEWMQSRGGMYLMPYQDQHGRWQVIDLGYTVPWGQLADVIAQGRAGDFHQTADTIGVFSGPVPDVIAAIPTGIDPFSDRKIMNPGDPAWMQTQAALTYAYGMAMPGFLTEKGAVGIPGLMPGKIPQAYSGHVDPRSGDPQLTKSQAWLRLFGVSVYPVDPEATRARNLRSMEYEVSESKRRRSERLKDKNLTDVEKSEIKRVFDAEIDRRQDALKEYREESKIPDKLKRGTVDEVIGEIAPIIDGKRKPEAVAALRDAGYPALAGLLQDMPVRTRPVVAEALARHVGMS